MATRYSISDAAEKLGVSTATVRRRCRRGELAFEMIDTPYGKQYMVMLDDEPGAVIVDIVPVASTITLEQFVSVLQGVLTEHDRDIVQPIFDKLTEQGDIIAKMGDEISELKGLLTVKQELEEEKQLSWWRKILHLK